MSEREILEKNSEASFEALDFWEQIRNSTVSQFKEIQLDINSKLNNIEKTIDSRLEKIEDDISSRLENITSSLSLINNLKKTFTDEIINLNNLHNTLKEFKSTNIVINNPTYEDLISQLREMLLTEAKSDGERFNKYIDNKNNLLNEFIVSRLDDLEKVAKRTVNTTDEIASSFNSFSESMKKGNSSILISETIVAKLLHSLRFIEKLPDSLQERILTFSENDFKSLQKLMEENFTKESKIVNEIDIKDESFIDLMRGANK